jgi:hypothetical protein
VGRGLCWSLLSVGSCCCSRGGVANLGDVRGVVCCVVLWCWEGRFDEGFRCKR